jgi:hypothetical protein
MTINRQDLAVGTIFIVIALFFAFNTFVGLFQPALPVGTPARMGPGFFPVTLSGLLFVVGVAIVIKGFRSQPMALNAVPWRGLLVILPVPVLFGLTIRGIGLAPATFMVAFISSFASRRMKLWMALALGLGLTIFCVLVFKVGLKVTMPVWGPWLTRLLP